MTPEIYPMFYSMLMCFWKPFRAQFLMKDMRPPARFCTAEAPQLKSLDPRVLPAQVTFTPFNCSAYPFCQSCTFKKSPRHFCSLLCRIENLSVRSPTHSLYSFLGILIDDKRSLALQVLQPHSPKISAWFSLNKLQSISTCKAVATNPGTRMIGEQGPALKALCLVLMFLIYLPPRQKLL